MDITISSQEIRITDMHAGDEVFMQTARKIQSFLTTLQDVDSIANTAIQQVDWHTTECSLQIKGKEFTPVNIFTAETRHEYTGSTLPLVKRYVFDILDSIREDCL